MAGNVLMEFCLEGAGLRVKDQLALKLGASGGWLLLVGPAALLKGERRPVQGESLQLSVKVKCAWVGRGHHGRSGCGPRCLLLQGCGSNGGGQGGEAGSSSGLGSLSAIISNCEEVLKCRALLRCGPPLLHWGRREDSLGWQLLRGWLGRSGNKGSVDTLTLV